MDNDLKARRKALGLRLEDVIRLLGPNASISFGTLWNYENRTLSGNVIMSKYQAVLDLYDRLEKEKQEKEPC